MRGTRVDWESEFLSAVQAIAQCTEEPVEYRIYYNTAGEITHCSMRNHPSDGNYIVVNQKEYDEYYKYTVENGMLKEIDHVHNFHVKLIKSTSGYAVVKNHAGLVLEPSDTYKHIEYYDYRTN